MSIKLECQLFVGHAGLSHPLDDVLPQQLALGRAKQVDDRNSVELGSVNRGPREVCRLSRVEKVC